MRTLPAILFAGILFVFAGCGNMNRSHQPEGITGTHGPAGTSGTGTAAPTGTVGTGSTGQPVAPEQVVPSENRQSTNNDPAITEAVQRRLTDAGFSQIHAKTHRGVVTLEGIISKSQVDEVLKMVQMIPEVQSVTSKLTVE
jgi:BON domain-containing protein